MNGLVVYYKSEQMKIADSPANYQNVLALLQLQLYNESPFKFYVADMLSRSLKRFNASIFRFVIPVMPTLVQQQLLFEYCLLLILVLSVMQCILQFSNETNQIFLYFENQFRLCAGMRFLKELWPNL